MSCAASGEGLIDCTDGCLQSADELRMQQQAQQLRARISARYVPSGRLQPHALMKASLDMCLLQLHTTLARDWPASFVQASLCPLNPPPPPLP